MPPRTASLPARIDHVVRHTLCARGFDLPGSPAARVARPRLAPRRMAAESGDIDRVGGGAAVTTPACHRQCRTRGARTTRSPVATHVAPFAMEVAPAPNAAIVARVTWVCGHFGATGGRRTVERIVHEAQVLPSSDRPSCVRCELLAGRHCTSAASPHAARYAVTDACHRARPTGAEKQLLSLEGCVSRHLGGYSRRARRDLRLGKGCPKIGAHQLCHRGTTTFAASFFPDIGKLSTVSANAHRNSTTCWPRLAISAAEICLNQTNIDPKRSNTKSRVVQPGPHVVDIWNLGPKVGRSWPHSCRYSATLC